MKNFQQYTFLQSVKMQFMVMLGGNSACLNRAILACRSVYREKAATTVLKMSIGVFGVTLVDWMEIIATFT
ncbi:hypothetical protein T01_10054 [Trichinella spiralis]|uniref:Uncharacterized protein n=1 Tax=Trichinella spiralis TaxID=6334 RepID=A0A0V1BWR8_TRISP|nr:hypothetical protein T01_10054 [Trichinella spiralis]